MTTKKLKLILIPSLSAGVAIATITPAIVLSNKAKIKIRYEEYGMMHRISENFDLSFYLNEQLAEDEDIKMTCKATFIEYGISNPRIDSEHPVDIDGEHIVYHMHIDIDRSKIRKGEDNFIALSCNFICFKKDTEKTLWSDTINKIYLSVHD